MISSAVSRNDMSLIDILQDLADNVNKGFKVKFYFIHCFARKTIPAAPCSTATPAPPVPPPHQHSLFHGSTSTPCSTAVY